MKKILSLVLSFVLLFSLFGCTNTKYTKYSKSFLELFDTASSITAYDTSQENFDKKYNELYKVIKKYSELFDIYNGYEDIINIKYLNDNAYKEPIEVDKEIIDLLNFSKRAYAVTNGKVNIAMGSVLSIWHDYREDGEALPPKSKLIEANKHTNIDDIIIDNKNSTVFFKDKELKIDVGAVAKGYVCNKIYEYITKNNLWQNAVISLGGNIITVGSKPDGKNFVIGIENPNSNDYLMKVNTKDNTSVVTSGSYQRYYTVNGKNYSHIIDPDTLYPAEYFTSVTVISSDSALADAFSTALFCMSYDDGIKLVESNDKIEAIWLDNNGKTYQSSGVKAIINEK
jgi:FAD:protein FMN transferase